MTANGARSKRSEILDPHEVRRGVGASSVQPGTALCGSSIVAPQHSGWRGSCTGVGREVTADD